MYESLNLKILSEDDQEHIQIWHTMATNDYFIISDTTV